MLWLWVITNKQLIPCAALASIQHCHCEQLLTCFSIIRQYDPQVSRCRTRGEPKRGYQWPYKSVDVLQKC